MASPIDWELGKRTSPRRGLSASKHRSNLNYRLAGHGAKLFYGDEIPALIEEAVLWLSASLPESKITFANSPNLRKRPYKFLDYCTAQDTALFFGRDRHIEELMADTLRSPLSLLYGKSGVGKTSMLQAGLFPRLKARRMDIRILRPTDLTGSATLPWFPEQEVLIVIDQGEELFTASDAETRNDFLNQLAISCQDEKDR